MIPQQPQFKEITRVRLEENLDLVFSVRVGDGLISVAQMKWTTIHGRRQGMWVKNAIVTDRRGIEEAANGFMACLEKLLEEEEKRKQANANGQTAIQGS